MQGSESTWPPAWKSSGCSSPRCSAPRTSKPACAASWKTAPAKPSSPAAETGPVPRLAVRAPGAPPVAVTAVPAAGLAAAVRAAVIGPAAPDVAPGQDHQRDQHDGCDDVGRAMEGVDDGLPVLAHRVAGHAQRRGPRD